MEEKIYNLEQASAVGVNKCLLEGYRALFHNFKPFLKQCYPVLIMLLGSVVFYSTYAITQTSLSVLTQFSLILPLTLFTIIIFCYGIWHSLLGIVAVSYLAKDIYENKQIQDFKTYINYVREHTKNYIKFWLKFFAFGISAIALYIAVLALICVIIGLLTTEISALLYFFSAAGIIMLLALPLITVTSLNIPAIYWAYVEKSKGFTSIFKSIKAAYKKPLQLIWFSIATVMPMHIICAILSPKSSDDINVLISSKLLLVEFGIALLIQMIIPFMCAFIYTRYHFEFTKDIDKK